MLHFDSGGLGALIFLKKPTNAKYSSSTSFPALLKERLPKSFFARDTITVAKELLGVIICHKSGTEFTAARIVETEAYLADDPACHAYANAQRCKLGITPSGRSKILFEEPGCAYVYLNYGMYWLFNVVTELPGTAGAVLIRGVEPVSGIDFMRSRRPKIKNDHQLTNGPGKLSIALGIGPEFNGLQMCESRELFLAKDPSFQLDHKTLVSTTRIGISKAKDHPWRYYIKGNPFVSVE